MNTILVNAVAVLVVLGVIVFVHEFGHFLAAKAFGVRVETFSLGFGTRLFGAKYGDTDYRVSLLPLGGYVKMAGENPMETPTGAADEFLSKSRWQRFIIAFAGPFMNAVLAVGLLIPVYMREYPRDPYLDQPAVVAAVQPNTPAAAAGIRPQDRIAVIEGAVNPDWETVMLKTTILVDHPLQVTLQRGDTEIHTTLQQSTDAMPFLGLLPEQPALIGEITAGSPAQQAGLRPGDRAVRLDGTSVGGADDLITRIQADEPPAATTKVGTTGHAVALQVVRDGKTVNLDVVPRLQVNQGKRQWMMGAVLTLPSDYYYVRLPFSQALRRSLADNKQNSMIILDLVGKLVSRQASIKNLNSPVGIASVAGDAARAPGLLPLLSLTAVISLNLGILNLLPIPLLDGGTILFLLIEGIMRHEMSMRVKERIYQAGFAFLLILMTVVIYNDIVHAIVVRN